MILRAILSVLAGYAVITAIIFTTFMCAYLVLGADGAFRTGSYDPSATWIAITFVLGLVAAAAGGYVTAAIARADGPPRVLAGLVLVVGLVVAIMTIAGMEGPALERRAELSNFEAMENARQPVWVALINPFLGAAGVWLGARQKRRAS